MEAIILAGGLGTRLRSVISELPKPMSPIGGRPFLELVLDFLDRQDVKKVILSVGYKHEVIENYFGKRYKDVSISYSVEEEPLGTGGGLKKAFDMVSLENIFIINGDTYFDVNLKHITAKHLSLNSDLTLFLKPLVDFNRYGTVMLQEGRVVRFLEKQPQKSGYINGGIYIAKSDLFSRFSMPEKFSFEVDFMQKYLNEFNINALVSDSLFIDIGIPEDYERAQRELISI